MFKDDTKRFQALSEVTVKCKCGCSVTITNKYKKVICGWCGRMVYLDKKQEFKEKLRKMI